MNPHPLRNAAVLLVIVTMSVPAAKLSDGLQTGKNYYFGAEFSRAISAFELARKANPSDPEAYFWLGRTYAISADLSVPVFATRARLKARMCLTRAAELAPESAEYRRELFNFLVNDDISTSALRQAELIFRQTPESDPEYALMRQQLAQASDERSSPENLAMTIVGAPLRTIAVLTQPRR